MKNKMNQQIKAGFWITFVGIIAVASLIACILIIQTPILQLMTLVSIALILCDSFVRTIWN